MVDQWLCGGVSEAITTYRDDAFDNLYAGVIEMKEQMNDYVGSNNSYGAYLPGWVCPVDPHDYGCSSDEELTYLRHCAEAAAKAHRNGDITVQPGDNWCITDNREGIEDTDCDWGYGKNFGQAVYVDLSGDGVKSEPIYICRALEVLTSLSDDPNRLTQSLIIHELGHSFEVSHADGTYSYNIIDNMYDVTPMATSYVRKEGGDKRGIGAKDDSDVCL